MARRKGRRNPLLVAVLASLPVALGLAVTMPDDVTPTWPWVPSLLGAIGILFLGAGALHLLRFLWPRANRILPVREDAPRHLRSMSGTRAGLALFFGFLLVVPSVSVVHSVIDRWDSAPLREHHEALMKAQGDIAKVERLLRRGVRPDATNRFGTSIVLDVRDLGTLRVLLAHGASPNVRDSDGWPALTLAASSGDLERVDVLLKAGARPDVPVGPEKQTALVAAYEYGHEAVVLRLIQAGARDDRATAANGRELPQDGGAPFVAVQSYLAALASGDVGRARSVWTDGDNESRWATIDFDHLRTGRPVKEPLFLNGFENELAADLFVTSQDGSDPVLSWGYHLVRDQGRWKIQREWLVSPGARSRRRP